MVSQSLFFSWFFLQKVFIYKWTKASIRFNSQTLWENSFCCRSSLKREADCILQEATNRTQSTKKYCNLEKYIYQLMSFVLIILFILIIIPLVCQGSKPLDVFSFYDPRRCKLNATPPKRILTGFFNFFMLKQQKKKSKRNKKPNG